MDQSLERIETALGAMGAGGPRNLRAYLAQPGPDFTKASASEIDQMIDLLLSKDPNSPTSLRFSNLLRSWDNSKEAKWVAATARNTSSRRRRIHELLGSDAALETRVDGLLPFYALDEPLIIAERHTEWYVPKPGVQDYYWSAYVQYLRDRRDWGEASLLNMDNSTRAIVECLANPESPTAYASRGLVMGYVQSGKTANFTGVVARAADAGYRLIVVLAGTWNILRNQTQRRFDKELLGKELLLNDEAYVNHPPSDWAEFIEHGADPSSLGHFTWQRLTRPDIDFKSLKAAIDNLEFERADKALPVYHPTNLRRLPVKLLVVKKHAGILKTLANDLRLIRTRLEHLPTLFIDDESDQAGINTADPSKAPPGQVLRKKTNLRIVELLKLFPRGQYVGYTATPYANALVDPDDPEDLFPKDFIISLDRPADYMGVSDFFDPSTDYADLNKADYSLSEIAYIRRVEAPVGADDEELKLALQSYVLSGAIKLYRAAQDPLRYKSAYFKHHTMLVHTSQLTGEHQSIGGRLQTLWDQCAFNTPRGMMDLEKLWSNDHRKVCSAMKKELIPPSFEALMTPLSDTIKRIQSGQKISLIVNSDSPDAPDFSASSVWKIIVGGNKLSRGYTVEGLTVSYYRRVAGTADTLMQMGRWFGFRPGYQDLVRVFLGVKDGKKRDSDLVSLFKEVCLMEERFRDELKRYVRRPGARRITPAEIPPLITMTGDLPPTAKNKMFNATVVTKNFGGQRSMQTLAPSTPPAMDKNIENAALLLKASKTIGTFLLGGRTKAGGKVQFNARAAEASNEQIVEFLSNYVWLESDFQSSDRPTDVRLQMEFLRKEKHGILGWLILAPQRKESYGKPLEVAEVGDFAVKERKRVEGRGFQVYGEPDHRLVAEFLADIAPGNEKLDDPTSSTTGLRDKHRGVMLLYPVRVKPEDSITIGYELVFPENDLSFDLHFSVIKKGGKVIEQRLDSH